MTLRCAAFLGAVLSVILQSQLGRAVKPDVCSEGDSDWVQFAIDGTFESTFANRLLELLKAELGPRQIAVCAMTRPAKRPPMATIRIVHSATSTIGIEVGVEDAITNKKVLRQLDLRSLPPDAHAMAIALGAAELLRASWAEVNLRSASKTTRPVPSSIRNTLADDTVTMHNRASLGVHIAAEEFTRGLVQGGFDARFVADMIGPMSVTIRAGARRAQTTQASDGRVQAEAWLLGAGSMLRLTPLAAPASLSLLGRMDFYQLRFSAEPNAGVSTTSGSRMAAAAGAGLAGSVLTSSLAQLDVEVVTGGVIRGVRATDTGQQIVALNGAWVGASLGMSIRFW